jgi:conjugal transfer mating pair stabilization protein TraN
MRKILSLLMILLLPLTGFADINNAYSEGQSVGQSVKNQAQNAIANFNPANTFPSTYTSNPSQTQYFGNANAIAGAAATVSTTNDAAIAVQDNYNNAPKYKIDPNSPEMVLGQLITNDAANISAGISDQYVNCNQKQVNCSMTQKTQMCTSTHAHALFCTKTLAVTVINPAPATCNHIEITNVTPANVLQTIGKVGSNTAYLVSGASSDFECVIGFTYADGGHATGSGTFTIPPYLSAKAMLVVGSNFIHVSGNALLTTSTEQTLKVIPGQTSSMALTLPQTGGDVSLTVNNGLRALGTFAYGQSIAMITVPSNPDPIEQDNWSDNCGTLSPDVNAGYCTMQGAPICTEGASTKTINGVAVTKDCWSYQQNYQCGNPTNDATCTALQAQNCTQKNSTCTQTVGGICLSYTDTYQCPQKTCAGQGVVCGGQFFCTNGTCYTPKNTPSTQQDMNKAVGGLAAANAASQSMNGQNVAVFSGKAMSCSNDAVGFSNCCRNSGWGQDLHLAHCSQSEKELGTARQNGLAIQVGGTYCSHRTLFNICTAHKQAFCVFDSQMAKIVQEQGRVGQLHISLGSSQSPQCTGLNPDQLQELDFSKIDFSALYNSIDGNMNFENPTDKQNAVQNQVQQFYQNGQSHG